MSGPDVGLGRKLYDRALKKGLSGGAGALGEAPPAFVDDRLYQLLLEICRGGKMPSASLWASTYRGQVVGGDGADEQVATSFLYKLLTGINQAAKEADRRLTTKPLDRISLEKFVNTISWFSVPRGATRFTGHPGGSQHSTAKGTGAWGDKTNNTALLDRHRRQLTRETGSRLLSDPRELSVDTVVNHMIRKAIKVSLQTFLPSLSNPENGRFAADTHPDIVQQAEDARSLLIHLEHRLKQEGKKSGERKSPLTAPGIIPATRPVLGEVSEVYIRKTKRLVRGEESERKQLEHLNARKLVKRLSKNLAESRRLGMHP